MNQKWSNFIYEHRPKRESHNAYVQSKYKQMLCMLQRHIITFPFWHLFKYSMRTFQNKLDIINHVPHCGKNMVYLNATAGAVRQNKVYSIGWLSQDICYQCQSLRSTSIEMHSRLLFNLMHICAGCWSIKCSRIHHQIRPLNTHCNVVSQHQCMITKCCPNLPHLNFKLNQNPQCGERINRYILHWCHHSNSIETWIFSKWK